jgi:hypothetical protein
MNNISTKLNIYNKIEKPILLQLDYSIHDSMRMQITNTPLCFIASSQIRHSIKVNEMKFLI